MKPVMQTRRGYQGNCFAACMASIFEIPIDFMPDPDVNNVTEFWDSWRAWLANRNLMAMIVYTKDGYTRWSGYYIGGWSWEGKDDGHAVVMKDGHIVHDPCPNGRPMSDENTYKGKLEYMVVFTVLDPTKPICFTESRSLSVCC